LKNVARDNPTIVTELAKRIDNWYPVNERQTLKSFE